MRKLAGTAGAVGLLATLCLTFLGAIAYQSSESLSVMHQQGVLRSLHSELRDDLNQSNDQQAVLSGHPLLSSPEFFAFVMNGKGDITARSWSGDTPAAMSSVHSAAMERPDAENGQKLLTTDQARFVWFDAPLEQEGSRLFIVHECHAVSMAATLGQFVLPIVVGALLVIWISFWATMTARRMIRDRIRQKELEDDLKRQEEINRIRSTFFSNMSHELRTPLNAIVGYSEMLKMGAFGSVGSERNEEYVGTIHSAGIHLTRLVGNILELSNLQSGDGGLSEDRIDIQDLVSDSIGMVSAAAEKLDIKVRTHLPSGMPFLRADPARVKQIMFGLLSNAIAHSEKGGLVEIRARHLGSGSICIRVSDQGAGIGLTDPNELLENYGNLHFDAGRSKSGAGFGLPLCNTVMKLHGGGIRIESKVGAGTTVHLTFPPERTVSRVAGVRISAAG